MKQYLTVFCIFLWSIWIGFAYTPNETDTKHLNEIKGVLNTVSTNDLWNYYQQFSILQQAVGNNDDKLNYYLTHLRDHSYNLFTTLKNLAKQQSKQEKSAFLEYHKDNLLLNTEVANNCLGRYNTLDNLSFAHNFPTALTIAVWYRESTCSYALPRNGNGPFQIISKDYGSGEITEEIFLQTVKDFLNFSWNKIIRYNDRNIGNELSVNLGYTGASYTDLWRFSALYNGLSWGTVYGEISPTAPKYFLEGYENDIRDGEHKKDWIFSMYLKMLEWELGH